MHPSRFVLLLAGGGVLLGSVLLGSLSGARSASAQAPMAERQQFQQALLVPPDDKDYVVTAIPPGAKAVVTDLVAYNVADGKSHKVAPAAEGYLWVGGYADGKSVALMNRIRTLGNETEQWHMTTGLELKGTPDLRVSCEKSGPNASPVLVYITGYITR